MVMIPKTNEVELLSKHVCMVMIPNIDTKKQFQPCSIEISQDFPELSQLRWGALR